MGSISLCMIVKNEEDVLARCLESVKSIVDEIIIIDTGSSDTTKEIAKSFTNKIYDFEWIDDFAAARNYSFSKATMEYIIWLDADDILLEPDKLALNKLKESLNPSVHMVMMKYNVAFDMHGNPILSYNRERLMLRSCNYRWISPIHEVITPSGNIIYSPISITHSKLHPTNPNRNLNIFEKMIERGESLDPRQQFYYARELYYHAQYETAIECFTKFLNDDIGWIENKISACQDIAECYYALAQPSQAFFALCKSFLYDAPRAEALCMLGKHFFNQQQYYTAIFFYTSASECEYTDSENGFISPDCYRFTPYIQLCVCYDRIGNYKKAEEYHLKCKIIKPNDSAVQLNNSYFKHINEKRKT